MSSTSRVELLARLQWVAAHGSDPLRFIESALEDRAITSETAAWLRARIGGESI